MDTISPTNGYDQCPDKWIGKKNSLFLFSFYRKIELELYLNLLQLKKTYFITNKQTPGFQENIASFYSVQCPSLPFNSQFTVVLDWGYLPLFKAIRFPLDDIWLLQCWREHIFYDQLQKSNDTKSNENIVTYVKQTIDCHDLLWF